MEHDHLIAMLNRLKPTAIRDQPDTLVDEAARRDGLSAKRYPWILSGARAEVE